MLKKFEQKYEWIDKEKFHLHEKIEAQQKFIQGDTKKHLNTAGGFGHNEPQLFKC